MTPCYIKSKKLHDMNGGNNMLKQLVDYLVNNPGVAKMVVQGQVSLVGVSAVEQKAILDVFNKQNSSGDFTTMGFWR